MYNEAVIRACIQQLRFWYTLKNQLVAHNSQGAQDQEMKALKTFRRARDANVAYFLILILYSSLLLLRMGYVMLKDKPVCPTAYGIKECPGSRFVSVSTPLAITCASLWVPSDLFLLQHCLCKLTSGVTGTNKHTKVFCFCFWFFLMESGVLCSSPSTSVFVFCCCICSVCCVFTATECFQLMLRKWGNQLEQCA